MQTTRETTYRDLRCAPSTVSTRAGHTLMVWHTDEPESFTLFLSIEQAERLARSLHDSLAHAEITRAECKS